MPASEARILANQANARLSTGPKTAEALKPFGAEDLAAYRKSNWIPFAPFLARVLIGGHVANVGDVHHMPNPVAVELQRASKRVVKKVATHVAEMLRQVNGRSA